uniref:Glutamine-dependent NAD(+) synthetase n=1 Tax=Hanusia phi TaxID=3032 RepID=A0A7S0EXQ7_9CRYP
MSFEQNKRRIQQSIAIAKREGARMRLGPELEISGYGCEDHFLEEDTLTHSWEVLADILREGSTDGILCDIGMPIMHNGVRYNCRVLCLDGDILLVRPKLFLANDGNYRETRWFTRWQYGWTLQDLLLPALVTDATRSKQTRVKIGPAILQLADTSVAAETCEELFTPNSPHITLALNGAEIITNGSGSHHNLRKLDKRLQLITSATCKSGGVYMYANQIGCDGGRLYFDGCALICSNGQVVAQGAQFSMQEVEVVTAAVDLSATRSMRGAFMSRCEQVSTVPVVPVIHVDFKLCGRPAATFPAPPIDVRVHHPMEEIARGPACWLWDYLRRSNQGGFFVALSGGADSSSVVAIVGNMCQMIVKEVKEGNETVLQDLRRVVGEETYQPDDAKELAGRLLYTCYMGTSNSSQATHDRSKQLAAEIGSFHLSAVIDPVISALMALFVSVVKREPRFKAYGGTDPRENLALQNIQARLRMVFGYFLAQLLPWSRGMRGSLLVLGTANVDEALRGYYTKYDCSAADINPIGSISKEDLKLFMAWGAEHLGYPELANVLAAPPTAELEPITADYTQLDEVDMGMTYKELSEYGQLRKQHRAGPVSMFRALAAKWGPVSPLGLSLEEVAAKVKKFFFYYSINRHKMTSLTPSYHAEDYSPEDNRHDLRQFLYDASWTWQFRAMDHLQQEMQQDMKKRGQGTEHRKA